ncbi:hypothetical protein PNQ20_05870 [Halobacterium salinarum]|nr:hypothetical protein [Halobacterium salinarum]MDL0136384.1 hypothetical protein [Halobacterium salinarum]
MRQKIRERTKGALEVFDLLGYTIEQRDAKQTLYDSKPEFLVETWERVTGRVDDEKSHASTLPGLFEFLHIATEGVPFQPENQMRMGIQRKYYRKNRVLEDSTVDFSATPGQSVEEMDTENPGELSYKELNEALRVGAISAEALERDKEEIAEKESFTTEIVEAQIEALKQSDETIDPHPDV